MEPSSCRDGSAIHRLVKPLGIAKHCLSLRTPAKLGEPLQLRCGATESRQVYDLLTDLGVHGNPLFAKGRMAMARDLVFSGVSAQNLYCFYWEVTRKFGKSIRDMGAFFASRLRKRLAMKTDVEWDQVVASGMAGVRATNQAKIAEKTKVRKALLDATRMASLVVDDLEGQRASANMFAMWRAGKSIHEIALSFSVDEVYAHAMVMAHIRRGGHHLRSVP